MLFLKQFAKSNFLEKIFAKTFAAVKVKGTQNLTFRKGETSGTHFRLCKISNFAFLRLLQLQKSLQIFFQKILFRKLFKNNISRGQIWNPVLCKTAVGESSTILIGESILQARKRKGVGGFSETVVYTAKLHEACSSSRMKGGRGGVGVRWRR